MRISPDQMLEQVQVQAYRHIGSCNSIGMSIASHQMLEQVIGIVKNGQVGPTDTGKGMSVPHIKGWEELEEEKEEEEEQKKKHDLEEEEEEEEEEG